MNTTMHNLQSILHTHYILYRQRCFSAVMLSKPVTLRQLRKGCHIRVNFSADPLTVYLVVSIQITDSISPIHCANVRGSPRNLVKRLQTPLQPTGSASEPQDACSTQGQEDPPCSTQLTEVQILTILIQEKGAWSDWSEICNTPAWYNRIRAESADWAGATNLCVCVCVCVRARSRVCVCVWERERLNPLLFRKWSGKLQSVADKEKKVPTQDVFLCPGPSLTGHWGLSNLHFSVSHLPPEWTNIEDEWLCLSSSQPTLIHKSLSGSLRLYDTVS